jgi:hypothetical protein
MSGQVLDRRGDGGFQPRDGKGHYAETTKVEPAAQVIDMHGGHPTPRDATAVPAPRPIRVLDQRDPAEAVRQQVEEE